MKISLKGKRIFAVLYLIAVTYLIFVLLLFTALLIRHSFIDIRNIEPSPYVPDVRRLVPRDVNTRCAVSAYTFHINSLGSRNSFEVKNNDKNIVVLLGDSYFFGFGLNDDQTLSYFLNRNDPNRRYVNLALPGNNICDSVAKYFEKCDSFSPPSLIVFQVLLINDIYASVIEDVIMEKTDRDYRYVWYPIRLWINKKFLFNCYLRITVNKIFSDLSDQRFSEYIETPLTKLLQKARSTGTKIMLIAYDDNYHRILNNYSTRLKQFCLENDIVFFRACDLIDRRYYRSRLPDQHPSGVLNRFMAEEVNKKIKVILDGRN
jgi:hypothetical protein